ncbi:MULTISPECIES: nitrate reductase molybdenum cofactor assembly chaperone [unclassified Paludibacterium]|uniref:nitrate reductase molybdenum cofactor assembly chaperone n=1 Tax=unclassified Paludibacterium TaxID=2618429 RepID=UPI001C058148|nr:nitrate reductase molybdenum cofactor assembly chaperone [Paludibacterium sp. B53371]BEV71342.1 nitrate reductase molybdenum cofactor assembly chaperone [Paludibacterium sp. THUN1379]
MRVFALISVLLQYPEPALQAASAELYQALDALPAEQQGRLRPLLDYLMSQPLLELQADYVAMFDRQRSLSLHLFEHVYGESRDRGGAMVSLMAAYAEHGLAMQADELPDYLPLFLECLGQIEPDAALCMLGDAVHVIELLAGRLLARQSPYAGAMSALVSLSPVAPLPISEPPVRDMDEAMERFGPAPDGIEPLLTPAPAMSVEPVRFYPRPARQGA